MSFRGLLRPGQGFKPYTILKRQGGVTKTGRPTTAQLEPAGQILGIISQAGQMEKEQWKQSGHPITHTVIQRGNINKAEANDVLELEGNRRFLIQGVRDPGELGHFTVYKVEERLDLQ